MRSKLHERSAIGGSAITETGGAASNEQDEICLPMSWQVLLFRYLIFQEDFDQNAVAIIFVYRLLVYLIWWSSECRTLPDHEAAVNCLPQESKISQEALSNRIHEL